MPRHPQYDPSSDTAQIRARVRRTTKRQLHIAAINANKTLQDMIEDILEGFVTTNCHDHIAGQHRSDQSVVEGAGVL